MSSVPMPLGGGESTPVDLVDDGVLWMINTAIFHPRGLALGRAPDGSLRLVGDGREGWVFEPVSAQVKKDQFDALIERHLRARRQ